MKNLSDNYGLNGWLEHAGFNCEIVDVNNPKAESWAVVARTIKKFPAAVLMGEHDEIKGKVEGQKQLMAELPRWKSYAKTMRGK